MKIAVVSDTHDHIWNIEKALPDLCRADVVLHCGDLCSPFVLRQLGDGLGEIPLHVVWGNNDGDTFLLGKVASAYEAIALHGAMAELKLGGLRVAMNHYPAIAHGLALSGQYDLVCYGHDHTAHEERLGDCMLLNPGEVMGMNGRATYAVIDSEMMQVAFIEID